MKIDAVLELLSSLSIFEKDGVRRFVKLENSEIDNCTRHLKIRKGEIVEESAQTSASQTEAAKPSFDFSKNEAISVPEKAIAASQEIESTNGAVTSTDEESSEATKEKTKPKNPKAIYKKPKSEKQKEQEYKDELLKEVNKGKPNGKKKDRKRKRRK